LRNRNFHASMFLKLLKASPDNDAKANSLSPAVLARDVAKIAMPTGSTLVKRPAESGEICSVEVEEK
jgi:hypothetical protein